jgi:hypothetical protein
MANWATMYSQRTRLPVLPRGVDPKTDWFYCKPFACRLPKTGCANRHRLSKQRTTEGISYQAVTYGACRNCNVGAAHARGEPTPLFMEATTMTDEVTTNGSTWPDRKCAVPKCGKIFHPLTALQRRCPECIETQPAARSRAKAKRKPARRMAAVRSAEPVLTQAEQNELVEQMQAAAAAPTNGHDPMVSAYDLLEMAGYSVTRIRTPSGELLRVS